jgi:hypothetical protein
MTIKLVGSSFFGLFFLVACSSTTTSSPSPNPGGGTGDDVSKRTAVSFVAPCTAAVCGEVPESSTAEKPECTATAGTCGWTDPDPNGSVSYRPCEDAECGTKPDASVCPAGTAFKGAACGSENSGACIWRSACSPPRSTTPCPDPNDCGDMPLIGVICKDGSSGELACMKQGAKCSWERTCD